MAFLTVLLGLVTLSTMTKNRNNPISVTTPKVTKASTISQTSDFHVVRELSMAFLISLLALVTLGDTTKKISVALPRVSKESTITQTSDCRMRELSMAFLTCLGHLGQRNNNRSYPISFVPPKVTKASTISQTSDSYNGSYLWPSLLAVVTLGSTTKNINDPISAALPKVTTSSTIAKTSDCCESLLSGLSP